MKETLQSTCSQLLSPEDLQISDNIVEFLKKRDSFIEILTDPKPIFKIYSTKKITISEIIPIIHNFNFKAIDEVSYELQRENNLYYIVKLNIFVNNIEKLKENKENIISLFSLVLNNILKIRNSIFQLTYLENFSRRDILLFIGIIKYEDQLISSFNEYLIINVLVKYSKLSKLYLNYFRVKFLEQNEALLKEYDREIESIIKEVKDITEDKILRLFYEIIKATKRTNFFLDKEFISLKIYTSEINFHLHGIVPKIEIFVMHPEMVGIHLRMDRVSRGGLRWSDRYDDFRNEIKSLMIAQEAKNAVIIPKGAKGGFLINKKDVSKEEFTNYYKIFINALLDMVDNKKKNRIIANEKIVKYDGDDFYFVVAADKGTSAMSDVANSISIERNFWLKDAFASGGSHGYHHKKLGITAKGAIKSAHRFFIEKEIDFFKKSISLVGIGSMNGDVFGNGMLESDKFLLKGAVSHKEIFIDPNPDPKISFEERKRLFFEKNSNWSNYDKSKISKGGGVFKRGEKEIFLSPEIKEFLKTDKDVMDSDELIQSILKADVDMLYLGGIGTYIKGSNESSVDIGDKANENVRVNSIDIRARVICEGANLGVTQEGRIEYAREGGKINLDSIDNSAGVNTSDHEVNLKILLNSLVDKNIINEEQRDESLKNLTDFVVQSVLWTNYLQALSISLDEYRSISNLKDFIKTIDILENYSKVFKRENFLIPKNSEIDLILTKDKKIVRPILAIIMLYAKILIQNLLIKSSMIDNSGFDKYLFKYFPKHLVSVYENEIKSHPLKREIIAMIVANNIINFCGASFLTNLETLGEEKFLLKIKAYLLTNELFKANDLRYEIYRNDFKIYYKKSYNFLIDLENAITFTANRMIEKLETSEINFENIESIKDKIFSALNIIGFNTKIDLEKSELDHFKALLEYLKLTIYIVEIKRENQLNFQDIAVLLYKMVKELKIDYLLQSLDTIVPKDETELILKKQLISILESSIVDLSKRIILFKRRGEAFEETIQSFFNETENQYKKYLARFNELKGEITIYKLNIVINQLYLLK